MEFPLKPSNVIARLKNIFNIKSGRQQDAEGNQTWYFHWKEHRDDGLPAYEAKSGTKKYFKFGELHREGDQAAIEWADGGREYFKNGLRHRVGGPAVTRPNGDNDWYQNDKLHREDGPAKERPNGQDEYWRNGEVWHEGKPAAVKVQAEKRVQEEIVIAVAEAETSEKNIDALKDIKARRPPPSLKPQ